MTYDFHDRASYLEASTMWKADYKEHTALIRQLKRDFKDAQRAFSKTDTGKYYEMSSVDRTAYFAAAAVVDKLRAERATAKTKATEMVNDRICMKEEAQQQYEEAKLAS